MLPENNPTLPIHAIFLLTEACDAKSPDRNSSHSSTCTQNPSYESLRLLDGGLLPSLLTLGAGLPLSSLFILGGGLPLSALAFPLAFSRGGGELVSLLRVRRGGGLPLSALAFPFPFDGGALLEPRLRLGGGVLESRPRRRGGGEGEREGDVVYFRRRVGGGERDSEPDGLRPRRVVLDFGGGERDREDEGLRPRLLGAGERDREREVE